MGEKIPWTSEVTGRQYPDRDALVAAEAHGWVVVSFHAIHGNAGCWGLWPTKQEAMNAMRRLKTGARREDEDRGKIYPPAITWRVRPLWREGEDRLLAAEAS